MAGKVAPARFMARPPEGTGARTRSMTVKPGDSLLHYRILGHLGTGGMGEVHLAEDTRLGRKVALKLLPLDVASDPDRLARFEREARALAALDHPGIVTIHAVEESGPLRFLTMELVQGRTLAQIIPKSGLTFDAILAYGIPLADALGAAHERGITHRDLKPGNIMIDDRGRLKVLDFGLARLGPAENADMAESPTVSATEAGRVLGTAPYMSPEQVRGQALDQRTDIFSLGVILFEMATGRRPFQGEKAADLISSILKDTPASITQLNPGLPRELGRVIRRCLEKDPGRRYQSARDIRNELEDLKRELESGELVATGQPLGRRTSRGWLLPVIALGLVGGGAAAGILLWSGGAGRAKAGALQNVNFTQLTRTAAHERNPSLSPDGKTVAYSSDASGNFDIFVLRVGGQNPVDLTADFPEPDLNPAFSPDGESIAFVSRRDGGGIFVMGATGESVRKVADGGASPCWSPDGKQIAFSEEGVASPYFRSGSRAALLVLALATGKTRRLFEGDAVQPAWSPHGDRIAFWGLREGGQRDLWTIPAEGGEPRSVTHDTSAEWNPVWAPDGGHLYFSSDRGGSLNLWRVSIDEGTGEITGDPEPLTAPSEDAGDFSISGDGHRLAYVSTVSRANLEALPFDPNHAAVTGPPVPITTGTLHVVGAKPSPDGRWIAFQSQTGMEEDLYVMRSDGTGLRRLTNDTYRDRGPEWAPDGQRLAFYSDRSGRYQIWTIRPDGSELTQVSSEADKGLWIGGWSPDGRRIAYVTPQDTRLVDAGLGAADQHPEILPPVPGEKEEYGFHSWSPDGRSMAGTVSSSPGVVLYWVEEKRYQRVSDAGSPPMMWLSDGRRLLLHWDGKPCLLDTRTGERRPIAGLSDPLPARITAISKDNHTLYFTRNTQESDIWLASLP
jgi:eukaryotic-like serine/threonine-protein kinase